MVNKWDLVTKETNTAIEFEKKLHLRVPSLRWVPMIFTSALTGQRVHKVLDMIVEVAEQRNRRIPTREVNEVIRELVTRIHPPHYRGMPIRIMYATQAATAPPTFVLFVNHAKGVPEHYMRYLTNGFRAAWKFSGTPLRLRLKGRREKEPESGR